MNALPTIKLFGHAILDTDRMTAIDALLARPGKTTAAFVNAHCVNVAAQSSEYSAALRAASVLLPDGSGLNMAARMVGRRFAENLNGTDLFPPLCRAAARLGKSVYFLGAEPGVAEKAAATAMSKAPGLKIAGVQHGFFDSADTDAVINRINDSGADILLVAMGVPMQDIWLNRNRWRLKPALAMGVGAMFDFHAGKVSRAPRALRALGQEWVWRLAVEPRRMAKRYLVGNPVFIARAVNNALMASRRRENPMPLTKRVLDICIASVALLALSPVFAATAFAVKLNSRGPVFFSQTRVGLRGECFRMIKFRSMYIDAEARRDALLARSDRQGVCFKSKEDPRITRVGRFIRRASIDELPQLLNVLKGEMSLVGPRPALPQEVAAYPSHALDRLNSVPGITGIWQVSGRADIGFERMVEMDRDYAAKRGLLLDLSLLLRTAGAVLSARGAY